MRRAAALIAGGGPAGAAAAILLARGGARPVLIERNREPRDSVCGGFLGADALTLLRRLGVDPEALGARPIHRARLIAGKRTVNAELPFAAAGLSRRTLDAALLDRAEAQGAQIERGIAIRRIDPVERRLHLSDDTQFGADALFLATGKHDARGAARPFAPEGDPALGLRIALEPTQALAAALDGVIELHLFRDGYAGLLRQEDGGVNLCLSVAQSRLKAADGQPARLIADLAREAPLLGERFAEAAAAGAWSSVARVPYGWRARRGEPGLFRLGDQSAVIASLAGDGIAIALSSATRAAHCYLQGGADAALAYQADFARHARRPVRLAHLLKHIGETPWLAGPLTGLFAHAPGLIRQAATMTRIGVG
jgi:flavin-dependent dehydrogenase